VAANVNRIGANQTISLLPHLSESSSDFTTPNPILEEIEKFSRTFGFSRENRKIPEDFQIFSRKLKSSRELSDFLEKIEKFWRIFKSSRGN
jgi:hypothetical protein